MTGHNKAYTCAIIGEDDPLMSASQSYALLKDKLKELIKRIISEYNCVEFISGMHRGAELLGAELVISMKNELDIKLWGILSSEEQWIGWPAAESERFFSLMEQADYEFRASNKKTVDSRSEQLKVIEEEADLFIVVKSKAELEINMMLTRAVKNGKKIFVLDPVSAEVSTFLELVE